MCRRNLRYALIAQPTTKPARPKVLRLNLRAIGADRKHVVNKRFRPILRVVWVAVLPCFPTPRRPLCLIHRSLPLAVTHERASFPVCAARRTLLGRYHFYLKEVGMPEGFFFLFLGAGLGPLMSAGNVVVWILAWVCAFWIAVRRFLNARKARLARQAEETTQPRALSEDERTQLLASQEAIDSAHSVEVMVAVGVGAAQLAAANRKLSAECESLASRYPEWRDMVLRASTQRGLTDPDGPLSVLAWIAAELNPEKARQQPGDLILRGKFLLSEREAVSSATFLRNGRIFDFHSRWWLERHRPRLFMKMQGEHAGRWPWGRSEVTPEKHLLVKVQRDLYWLDKALGAVTPSQQSTPPTSTSSAIYSAPDSK